MKSLFWHRRDLRINDNAGLYKALRQSENVIPIFIFDTTILDRLPSNDQRVLFIHTYVEKLKQQYRSHGSDLHVLHGDPKELIPEFCTANNITSLFTNRDYEPYALQRDQFLYEALRSIGVSFYGTKDHVIFEKNEVTKDDGLPYTVFTPYSRKWKSKMNDYYLSSYPVEKYLGKLLKAESESSVPSMQDLGFKTDQIVPFPEEKVSDALIKKYKDQRDLPSVSGTSRLSVHLRFGTISIRQLAKQAMQQSETFLNELIWRDFYQMILFHFPHSVNKSFKPQYDRIEWEHNEEHFKAWCEGRTGYPMVDAGMRELNATGFMHNRVRMVTASFLTKHLLLDWRLGEAYFAEKLMDFELASNIGGWQWASGTGCDAAPYFRVFNPESQQQKFDPKFEYIKKWVPEFGTADYPRPIVEHSSARIRAISRYKEGLTV